MRSSPGLKKLYRTGWFWDFGSASNLEAVAELIRDPLKHRELLSTAPNPGVNMEYVSTLESRVHSPPDRWSGSILLHYVPDKLILDADSFLGYTLALGRRPWPSLKTIAAAMRNDVNNKIKARWTRITVTSDTASDGALVGHGVTIEDRQPKWDNRALLDGIHRY